ncbi:uncharacterized protein LOC126669708 [Mercurialis annua]|uniref:uncharacterized protein LOC126669708 n=1 Tax=Mercurialis annua TaxID=3986 RepID=UPI002160A3F4|nr:uncharacterized protein LOC126669708 [Mercurialis annua]
MKRSHLYLASLLTLLVAFTFQFEAQAAPSGPFINYLSSFLKWSSSKTHQSDGNLLQYEDGYLVETVVQGNEIGVLPYKIRVSQDGELYAVDQLSSNIVKITPPLSQYSRARLVAGSFQGYTGHVDGKANEARFNHPKGVTMDNKGNVYVADTLNLAIRKIGDAGVTTIAGGKSNSAGYRDGPSEDAKFSTDFDVVYVHSTCSLLVVDRGNAALRQISLYQEDCDHQSSSLTFTDLLMVVGAVFAGYFACMLQQGFGSSFFCKTEQYSESEFESTPPIQGMKEEAGWPSFGQLMVDLCKLALEALANMFLYLIPSWGRSRKGLTPLKDKLRMPEDEVQRQTLSETRQSIHASVQSDTYSEIKPPKIKSATSLSTKYRSSKRAEFYGSGEVPSSGRSKGHREKTRHRQRDKSGEVVSGIEQKHVDYENPKFDHYNMRSKHGSDNSYQF